MKQVVIYKVSGQKPNIFEPISDFYMIYMPISNPEEHAEYLRKEYNADIEILATKKTMKGAMPHGYLARINSGIRTQINPRVKEMHNLEEAYMVISGECAESTIENLIESEKFEKIK